MIVLFQLPVLSSAVEHKNWLSVIPEQLDNFKTVENSSGIEQSTVFKKNAYKDNEIILTIAYDRGASSNWIMDFQINQGQ